MTRVFITRPIPERGVELLRETLGDYAVEVFPHDRSIGREELLHFARGTEAILTMLTDEVDGALMDAIGPQLRVVANYAVGYNNIDIKAATQRGIVVTNTPGVLTEATADLTWAILMATARRLGEAERFLRASQWAGWGPMLFLGVDIYGKTLGIYGMGRIGQAVARRARGFNMRVLYTTRTPIDADLERELNAKAVDKAALLAESDFISIHCPLTPETKHAFGAAEFRAMKPTACLINTSRGPVVDEKALAAALQAKEIFAAGLDVFEHEPKVATELLECDNVLLIPHLGSATTETRTNMAEIAAMNIIARLNGKAPKNAVNPKEE